MDARLLTVLLIAGICCANAVPAPPCICTLQWDPVCGSNGKTYGNQCGLNCDKTTELTLVKSCQGECPCQSQRSLSHDGVCICTMEYNPVCGSNGKTYGNECSMNCAAKSETDLLVKSCQGACPCKQQWTNTGESLEDLLKIMDPRPLLLLFVAGICYAQEPCTCPYNYDPVCGSDGETYANECSLGCTAKNNPSPLTISYKGPCTKRRSAQGQCGCQYNYSPVCGSNGETYGNECELDCEAQNNPSLFLVKSYDGACNKRRAVQNPCICPLNLEPVCGSDGVSYANECTLNCTAENNPSLFLKKSHGGECIERRSAEEPCPCPKNYVPVCGSNGVTYGNECNLKCAEKTNPALNVACAQECPCP